MSTPKAVRAKSSVSIKSVAIPAEHGGWGFLCEPLLLGFLIAPSLPGIGLVLMMTAVFLLHQPFKIVVKDRRKGRVYERTRLAQQFLMIYGVIGAAGFAITWTSAANPLWIVPLLAAAPFAVLQLIFELRNDGRSLISEIVGAVVLATSAPAMLLAADHTPLLAVLEWGVLTLRIIPAILYVRARLRLIHGKPTRHQIVVILHVMAMGIGFLLWAGGLANGVIVLATGALVARAVYGLYFSPPVAAKVVGFQEVFFGITYVVVCIFAL